MSQEPCMVCGFRVVSDDAHVKPRREFDYSEENRLLNIIPLCPTHHRMFDLGLIGICPESHKLVLLLEGDLEVRDPRGSFQNIREEYIEASNSKVQPKVRAAIGSLSDQTHASLCPEHQKEK